MDVCGYAGRLYIDLTTRTIEEKPLDLDLAVKFLGGMGLQLRMLYDLLKPGTDPFSLIARYDRVWPLDRHECSGNAAGNGDAEIPGDGSHRLGRRGNETRFSMPKLAGYDHIVITGKQINPSI